MHSSIGENIVMIETSVTASKILYFVLPATKDSIHLLCIITIITIIIISIISIIISSIIITIIIIISIITIIIIIIIFFFLHHVRYAGPMGTICAHLHFSNWRSIRLQQSAELRHKSLRFQW